MRETTWDNRGTETGKGAGSPVCQAEEWSLDGGQWGAMEALCAGGGDTDKSV